MPRPIPSSLPTASTPDGWTTPGGYQNYELGLGRRYIFDGSRVVTERTFEPGSTLAEVICELERIHVGSILFTAIDADTDGAAAETCLDMEGNSSYAGGLASPPSGVSFYYYTNRSGRVAAYACKHSDEVVYEYLVHRAFGEVVYLGVLDNGTSPGTASDKKEDTITTLGDNNAEMLTAQSSHAPARRVSLIGATYVTGHWRDFSVEGVQVKNPMRAPTFTGNGNRPFGVVETDETPEEIYKRCEEKCFTDFKECTKGAGGPWGGIARVGGCMLKYYDCTFLCEKKKWGRAVVVLVWVKLPNGQWDLIPRETQDTSCGNCYRHAHGDPRKDGEDHDSTIPNACDCNELLQALKKRGLTDAWAGVNEQGKYDENKIECKENEVQVCAYVKSTRPCDNHYVYKDSIHGWLSKMGDSEVRKISDPNNLVGADGQSESSAEYKLCGCYCRPTEGVDTDSLPTE